MRACWLLFLCLGSASAHAQAVNRDGGIENQKWELEEGSAFKPTATLLHELEDSNAGDRMYAGRELLRRVRQAKRLAASKNELKSLEARYNYSDYQADIVPACIRALDEDNVRKHCARMLMELEATSALDRLRKHHELEQRGKIKGILADAISTLEAS